jgi:glucose-1-phosphate thymidylyltransferase
MQGSIKRKGVVLAGGSGSRLYPCTEIVCKQLLPVYDKPMIYYPLSMLMLLGLREILIISTPRDTPLIRGLLGDGSQLGIELSYAVQAAPRGIAEAFLVGEEFVAGHAAALTLGDNLFYGYLDEFRRGCALDTGAVIFGYPVKDPERFGIVEVAEDGRVLSLEEKPPSPRSNLAVPGIYFYDDSVVERAKRLQPSARGELEITDLNRSYLTDGALHCVRLGRGIAWLDTGTPESMADASAFIGMLEVRQGVKIGCVEEVALNQGFITRDQLARTLARYPDSPYRRYCERLVREASDGRSAGGRPG